MTTDPFAHQHLHLTDPASWYEAIYTGARGDASNVPWAKMSVTPVLANWPEHHHPGSSGKRALVVGCGLGDDAEALVRHVLGVTAFDISPRAIVWCRERFPQSRVDYRVTDLLHPPSGFRHAFDFVFEARTIQSLPPDFHPGALSAVADFVAPAGTLLLFCLGRESGEASDSHACPLAKTELDILQRHGLTEVSFKDWDTEESRRYLAEYTRETAVG